MKMNYLTHEETFLEQDSGGKDPANNMKRNLFLDCLTCDKSFWGHDLQRKDVRFTREKIFVHSQLLILAGTV